MALFGQALLAAAKFADLRAAAGKVGKLLSAAPVTKCAGLWKLTSVLWRHKSGQPFVYSYSSLLQRSVHPRNVPKSHQVHLTHRNARLMGHSVTVEQRTTHLLQVVNHLAGAVTQEPVSINPTLTATDRNSAMSGARTRVRSTRMSRTITWVNKAQSKQSPEQKTQSVVRTSPTSACMERTSGAS